MTNTPKLGVALTKCYFCQGDSDIIIMNTTLTEKRARQVKEMNHKVVSMEPCQTCHEHMKQGIILITIDHGKSEPDWMMNPGKDGIPNPYRTGGFFVIKEEALSQVLSDAPEMLKWAMKHRFLFIEHEAAEKIGLFDHVTEKEA